MADATFSGKVLSGAWKLLTRDPRHPVSEEICLKAKATPHVTDPCPSPGQGPLHELDSLDLRMEFFSTVGIEMDKRG